MMMSAAATTTRSMVLLLQLGVVVVKKALSCPFLVNLTRDCCRGCPSLKKVVSESWRYERSPPNIATMIAPPQTAGGDDSGGGDQVVVVVLAAADDDGRNQTGKKRSSPSRSSRWPRTRGQLRPTRRATGRARSGPVELRTSLVNSMTMMPMPMPTPRTTTLVAGVVVVVIAQSSPLLLSLL
jgi:hypothetical protein